MHKTSMIAVALAFFIISFDMITKAWVVHTIPVNSSFSFTYPYGGIAVFKNFYGIEFSIIHLANKGAAWGILPEWQDFLLIIRTMIIGGLILHLMLFNQNANNLLPMSMIIAGALGNVLDTFIYGHVIDMIHFVLWGYDFPAFNVADSAICLGVAFLFLTSFAPQKKKHSFSA